MQCPKCGAKLPPGTIFCDECGAKAGEVDSIQSAIPKLEASAPALATSSMP